MNYPGGKILQSYSMAFDGHLLKRGFWLYVWEIKGPLSRHVYVGRTGDSSSARASSPFKRIGQHLDPSPNAKGNALGKQLQRAGVNYEECSFEMVAVGPVYPEQADYRRGPRFTRRRAWLARMGMARVRNALAEGPSTSIQSSVPGAAPAEMVPIRKWPPSPSRAPNRGGALLEDCGERA